MIIFYNKNILFPSFEVFLRVYHWFSSVFQDMLILIKFPFAVTMFCFNLKAFTGK